MQGATEILDADAKHSKTLADILADAFTRDPVMNWVIPEPHFYTDFFQLLIRDLFQPRGDQLSLSVCSCAQMMTQP